MFMWSDMGGYGDSYTFIDEEKTKEKETVKSYLANMQAEIKSKLDNGDTDKQELLKLFKLLNAIELVGRYI